MLTGSKLNDILVWKILMIANAAANGDDITSRS